MKYRITGPENIYCEINLPASKSISNRALILKALSAKPTKLNNISRCDDTLVIQNAFSFDSNIIDIKAAGTAMRFLTAYFSIMPGEWILTGTERMKNRPIKILVDALRELGAIIYYVEKEGYPPLRIVGQVIRKDEISISGSVSSQYISALMLIGPSLTKGLTINVKPPILSKPYISLTGKMMKEFGATISEKNDKIIIPPAEYKLPEYTIEADWSAASYWYQMVALAQIGEVELSGLFKDSPQGDSNIKDLFADLGVKTEFTDKGIKLTKSKILIHKMFYDFTDMPDMVQTFVVTCCLLDVPFIFSGLQTLKIKETDRIEALKKEMRKLGYVLDIQNDIIIEWDKDKCLADANPVIETYEDHRMAMAFAPVAIVKGSIDIDSPMVITKSYPEYWDDLKKAGFQIEQL